MATSLNEVYKAIGTLTAEVAGMRKDLQESEARSAESTRRADESRANVHRRLDEVVLRTTHLETDMLAVKNKVDGVQQVTDDIKVMRERAQGAGTLGYWLLRLGAVILGGAGWIAATYTWLTGRPLP